MADSPHNLTLIDKAPDTAPPSGTVVATPFGPLVMAPQMDLDSAATADRFLVMGEHANLWFEGRSPVLIVTFDNLATIEEGWPRGPWLDRHMKRLGYSVLGVQSHAKDWFRQPTAPALLQGLVDRGFFGRFDKVLLVGASMGGFAAINFAPLIAGAAVLAFSPQSTMNRRIAPFEKRFRYSVRRTNWIAKAYQDAALAVANLRKLTLIYDPFVPEDRAHALRLTGPNVTHLRTPHCTHEAVRVIIKSGALAGLVRDLIDHDSVGPGFWQGFRKRRTVAKWQQALLEEAARRKHPRLVVQAATAFLETGADQPDKDLGFARRAKRHAAKQLKGQ